MRSRATALELAKIAGVDVSTLFATARTLRELMEELEVEGNE